jgi:hypothetical protein
MVFAVGCGGGGGGGGNGGSSSSSSSSSSGGGSSSSSSSSSSSGGPLALGLVGHWTLNGNVKDAGPGGFDGELHGCAPNADQTGAPGQALYFGGPRAGTTDGDYATVNHGSFLPPRAEAITVATWVMLSEPESNAWVAQGEDFVIWQSGSAIGLSISTPTTDGVKASVDLTSPRWVHFVGTYDGTTLRVYLDGVLSASRDHVHPGPISSLTDGVLRLGADKRLTEYWSGVMSDLRLYDRVLTDTEIADLYALGG